MKSSKTYLQLSAILAVAAGLAACGGYTTVSLGGSVSGLVSDGLVLANGSSTVSIPKNATSYTFPDQIDAHGSYAITVKTQPPHYTCGVDNATGRATGLSITYANVFCTKTLHTVGGTLVGLTGANLQLTNGADTLSPSAGATQFTFATKVAEEEAYGVAVLRHPDGQTCTVQNGTAYMGTTDVTNIVVTCVNR
ncbi:MAG TPA: hypothetical protein VEC06_19560 [Paucimonas sp.]|nr:hypothetical protein [Paucimonas sp.]